MSLFDVDKTELLLRVLDRHGRIAKPRMGWQPISCINNSFHMRGDRNPSASVNLGLGRYTCHACGMHGDGFQLMLELENMQAKETLAALGFEAGAIQKEETWIL